MTARAINPFHAFLMIVLIVFWGSSFVIVKIALGEGLTPISIATFRFLVAGALFAFALSVKKIRQPAFRLLVDKNDVLSMFLLAFCGVTLFFSAQYVGIQMAGASIAAIFACLLSPILIAILSATLLREKLTKVQTFGICLAAAGALTVILGGSLSFSDSSRFLIGSLILLLTPILWAGYSVLGKKVMERYSPLLVVGYVTVIGGLCLIPFSFAENSAHIILSLNVYGWSAILFLAGACSFFGYYVWFYVLEKVGASVTSSFLFAEPLITVLLAAVFVGETIGWCIVLGGFLIFIGVYLVTTAKQIESRG